MAKKTVKPVEEEVLEVQEEVQEVEGVEEEAVESNVLPDELIGPNGEELLFPNGPSVAQVEEWKSRFGDEVYLTEFEDDIFLWRPITRKEYKGVMKIQNADSFYKEERICEAVVLYPANYNFMVMTAGKAGIPTLLAELVMEKSGFQAKTGAMKL
jgi:hypothetical protein